MKYIISDTLSITESYSIVKATEEAERFFDRGASHVTVKACGAVHFVDGGTYRGWDIDMVYDGGTVELAEDSRFAGRFVRSTTYNGESFHDFVLVGKALDTYSRRWFNVYAMVDGNPNQKLFMKTSRGMSQVSRGEKYTDLKITL